MDNTQVNKITGHFDDCLRYRLPEEVIEKATCWYKYFDPTIKCSSNICNKGCFFKIKDQLIGFCFEHWKITCNAQTPHRWLSCLTSCGNRVCDQLNYSYDKRLRIMYTIVNEKLKIGQVHSIETVNKKRTVENSQTNRTVENSQTNSKKQKVNNKKT